MKEGLWFTKPWWSEYTYGKLILMSVGAICAYMALMSDQTLFRSVVAIYLAGKFGVALSKIFITVRPVGQQRKEK